MEITYKVNGQVSAQAVAEIYRATGLPRPLAPELVEQMLAHADVIITAWNGEKMVGFLRAMTDFICECYLNDLAVIPEYQHQGIGKRLLAELRRLLDDDALIVALAARGAGGFYAKVGFSNFKRPEDTWYVVIER